MKRTLTEQLVVQKLLQARLSEFKLKNPTFSQRAFARKLGINSGALSAILNGKRRVSEKFVLKLTNRLYLDPQLVNPTARAEPIRL